MKYERYCYVLFYCFHYHVMNCFIAQYYRMWSYMYLIKRKGKRVNKRIYKYWYKTSLCEWLS